METLSFGQMESVYGGTDWIGVSCGVIGAGSVVYGAGAMAGWWNPVGWACGALLVIDGACAVYGIYSSW